MLEKKTVIVGVSGSIAAYKAATLVSMLEKEKCDVHVIMTKNATNFINPITFETLTGNKCIYDTFDRNFELKAGHISLAKKADLFVVAPASADVIGKISSGVADDMLTTTIMAAKCPKIIVPAMNTAMYENPIVQDNMKRLECYGYEIIEPEDGLLACGDVGKGKMPEPEVIMAYIKKDIAMEKDMKNKRVLVTAGPTMEAIDPVRFITNHSSGKMGYAIAENAALRGAKVTLITGKTSIQKPRFVKVCEAVCAKEMQKAVEDNFDTQDIVIMAAAVADYRPKIVSENKIKKSSGEMNLPLEKTTDILKSVSEKRQNQFICGFSMETENLLENSKKKLKEKHLDMICANSLTEEDAGFESDTNKVTVITKDDTIDLKKGSKQEVAKKILDIIMQKMQGRKS